MKQIKPSFKVLDTSDPIRHLEYVAKVCRDGKPAETEKESINFLTKLAKLQHFSVFEHFYLTFGLDDEFEGIRFESPFYHDL